LKTSGDITGIALRVDVEIGFSTSTEKKNLKGKASQVLYLSSVVETEKISFFLFSKMGF
jgi:hypothetical protein